MNRHFLRLINQGRRPGCSGGERAAYDLAVAIVENAGRLDDAALEGAVEFLRFAWMNPNKSRDILEGEDRG